MLRSFSLEFFIKIIIKKNKNNYKKNLTLTYFIKLNKIWHKTIFCNLNNIFLKFKRDFNFSNTELSTISKNLLLLNFCIVTFTILTLAILLIIGDLSNKYVVSHISSDLPIFYRITATWAGSSGSLLFWYWLQSLFSAVLIKQTKNFPNNQKPVLYLVLGFLQLFFILLLIFFKDAQPFRVFPMLMLEGRGINPLLLHWGMIIHPPILYFGYVSSAIPFAILITSLISGSNNEKIYNLLRKWTIFTWFFLGTGILLGSKWAYEELGWGGYWAWDPVENASLIPWLILTAFLHSFIVQRRLEILRFWNILLIILAFHLCLLGTWITRSGVLQGPHSFAESSIGKPMIIFILISFFYYIRFLFFFNYKLKPQKNLESLTSKEGSMLLNNLIMVISTFIILMGVFSPLLPLECSFVNNKLNCFKVEWKLDNYNRLLIPLGLLTLFLMGASPLLNWRRAVVKNWKKNFSYPLIFGILASVIYSFSYGLFFTRYSGPNVSTWGSDLYSEILAILTFGICIFVITGIIQEYILGIRSRQLRFTNEAKLRSFINLLLNNKSRYGGYLVHLSIVFLFIGYSGSAFKKTKKIEFIYTKVFEKDKSDYIHYYSGDLAYIENYRIQAKDFYFRPVYDINLNSKKSPRFTFAQQAHYYVTRGKNNLLIQNEKEGPKSYLEANKNPKLTNQILKFASGFILDGHLKTERHFYPQVDPVSGEVLRNMQKHAVHISTSKPDIRSTWFEDLYIQLGSINIPENNKKELINNQNISLNHFYEAYFVLFQKDIRAYYELFPTYIVANLEIWINPLTKFIWFGSLTFFLSGLFLFLPLGNDKNT